MKYYLNFNWLEQPQILLFNLNNHPFICNKIKFSVVVNLTYYVKSFSVDIGWYFYCCSCIVGIEDFKRNTADFKLLPP